MNIAQIHNATQHVTFDGKTFLIDPMLTAEGTYSGFAGATRAEIRNLTVDLPVDTDTLFDIDALTVTHLHEDHWDGSVACVAPRDKPIYIQDDRDAQVLREQGFMQLTVLTQNTALGDVTLRKAGGQHGSDRAYAVPQMAERLGDACGVIFQHPAEKMLYLAGDTIWCDEAEASMRIFQPGVVILNAGFVHITGFGPTIMGAEDILETRFTLSETQIVATHAEAVNHRLLTCAISKEYVCDNQIAQFVNVPEDGETLTFQAPQRTCM